MLSVLQWGGARCTQRARSEIRWGRLALNTAAASTAAAGAAAGAAATLSGEHRSLNDIHGRPRQQNEPFWGTKGRDA